MTCNSESRRFQSSPGTDLINDLMVVTFSAKLTVFHMKCVIVTARRYASAVYAMALCLSSVSVCPSQVGVLLKWLNGLSGFSARRLPSSYLTLCCKEIRVTPKIRVVGVRKIYVNFSNTVHEFEIVYIFKGPRREITHLPSNFVRSVTRLCREFG